MKKHPLISYFALTFPVWLLGNITLVMFMAYAYNATRGNIPLMIVIHWTYNLAGVLVPMVTTMRPTGFYS